MDKEKLHISEQIAFMEQMLECEEWIEELASMELAKMPDYLPEEILEHILVKERRECLKPVAKWLSLLGYSVKVGFAVACAIVALFNIPDLSRLRRQPEPVTYERSSYIADAFQFITEKIFDGGIEND